MQKIIQVLLVTILMAGHFSQNIVIDNSTLISPCTTGARSTVDSYLITGTVGDNITVALNQNWETLVFIKVLRRSLPQLETICKLYVGTGTCSPISTIRCECFYNTTTDQARFTVSDTVQARDSNATIFVQWDNPYGASTYSSKNYTFPEIYDVNAAQLNLTIAGVTGNLPSGSCSFSLTLNKSNYLELCCFNTAKPCYPQISFNGDVTNNTECVTYPASQLASDGVTGNLVLSYSVCNLTDNRQGSSCTVIPKLVPPPQPPRPCGTTCIAIIVPVVVVICVAVGVGVAVYCYKKKKTSKAVCSHGTNENTDKANTSEHHKTDRQHSEHTNKAFDGNDGRRSSPSEVTVHGVKTTTDENIQQHNTVHEKDNKQISGRTNDGNASQTVPENPRRLPPLKGTHNHSQLHPTTVESRPISIEITSTNS